MTLSELNIHHLRNIEIAQLKLHSKCNFFYGANGSGKTSLLEALYLLSSGHSFRTREISPLISQGESFLTVFARTFSDESISIQKSLSGPTQVKLNNQYCHSSSELARFLPCQVFYQDIFQIIDAGPSVRRSLLDWGMFHVKHSYHSIWKSYRSVLKQRNALLRQNAKPPAFVPWDAQLVELACELDTLRSDYFQQWSATFQEILLQLTDISCVIHYYKGWDRKSSGKSLTLILAEQLSSDLQRQYTSSGAHQADILFDLSSKKAKQLLSRGQQKIILIALKLAQASLLSTDCIYLLDDISAELDTEHFTSLLNYLCSVKGQLFITSLGLANLSLLKCKLESQFFSLQNGLFIPE